LEAVGRQDFQPALVMDGFGVGQDAVEIEENRIKFQGYNLA
jgi:hypothetical protein